MKKSFVAVTCITLLLTACKEKPPVIIFHAPTSVDTTYVLSTPPAADAHNVLVEEYTGASCTNCPAAHEMLNELQATHVGRINVVGLYITGPAQTRPPAHAKYDFRHDEATTIANNIYGGVNTLPSGGVDRTRVSGNLKLDRSVWAATIESSLSIADSVNLAIESGYDATDNQASIKVTVTYAKSVGYPHNLSIMIVEDSMIDVQEYPNTDTAHPGGKDDHYVFTNVFRGMVTAVPVGDPMLPGTPIKEAGRVVIRNYKYKPTNILNAANCRVIAFINSAVTGDYRVLQSAQVRMK